MGLDLSSPAFADGGPIPEEYGYTARNVNPPLTIAGVPDAAESLVLLMDDPDAVEPAGTVWDHWIVYDLDPELREVPEDWSVDGVEGRNDFGEVGYGGPNPPDREHTYRVRLYALDRELSLSGVEGKDAVEAAIDGHVLARATLTGTYAP